MTLLEAVLEQRDLFKQSRLPSLYSDFANLKTTNRDGYDANCQAWATALGRALLITDTAATTTSGGGGETDVVKLLKDRCCIVADQQLASALAHSQWGRPLALGSVEVSHTLSEYCIGIGN